MKNLALQRPDKSQRSEVRSVQQSNPKPKPNLNLKQKPQSKSEPEQHKPKHHPYQAIGVVEGKLHLEDDRLSLQLPDARIPLCGLDAKFALWFISRPALMFSSVDRMWLVYPKSRGERLSFFLKGLCDSREVMPIDHFRIHGKLLAASDGVMTIGIQRNLSLMAFKELQSKGMITSQFDRFVVTVDGQPPVAVGKAIRLNCVRNGDRLTVSVEGF